MLLAPKPMKRVMKKLTRIDRADYAFDAWNQCELSVSEVREQSIEGRQRVSG